MAIKRKHNYDGTMVLATRTGKLQPMVELWLQKHPGKSASDLVLEGLCALPSFRELAEKTGMTVLLNKKGRA